MSVFDRKAELERKNALLAQIWAEKETRRKEKKLQDNQNAARSAVAGLEVDERTALD